MKDVAYSINLFVGGGGAGEVVIPSGKKFPFKHAANGSDKRRAIEKAKKHAIANPSAEWQNADSSMRSVASREQFREQQAEAKADIDAKVAAKKAADAEKRRDPNPHAFLLEQAKSEPLGTHVGAQAAHDRKVAMYQAKYGEWEQEQAITKQEAAEQRELESSDEFQWLTDGIDSTQNVSRADGFDVEVEQLELAREYQKKGLIDEASAIVSEIQRAQLDRAADTKISASKQIADGHADYIAGMEREQAVKESQGATE